MHIEIDLDSNPLIEYLLKYFIKQNIEYSLNYFINQNILNEIRRPLIKNSPEQ